MEIKLHGGKCCGVKIIHGFEYPTTPAGERPALADGETSFASVQTASNDYAANQKPFYNLEAPAESNAERFNRYVDFVVEKRPHGMIEVVLTNSQLAQGWTPVLEEKGFKKVGEAINSNSSNKINLFLLCY